MTEVTATPQSPAPVPGRDADGAPNRNSSRLETPSSRAHPLMLHLRWFIRLRWLAGAAVLVGSLIDWRWLGWYGGDWRIACLGVAILAYNVLLWAIARRVFNFRDRGLMLTLAWTQILLDLGCLTALTTFSGGLLSPVLGFFVFHMVFASLLLPQVMAYGGAALAMAMMSGGLALSDQWPAQRGGRMIMIGWMVTLLLTVYLANHITRRLREQRRRLVRQNRRVRAMSQRLLRQRQVMIQHEKMVALGQMAAGVAHEIANPLASMASLLELMQRHPERVVVPAKGEGGPVPSGPRGDGGQVTQAEKSRAALAALREQVDRITQIIQQMKTFSTPQPTGSEEGSRPELPLNEVVEQALQMLRYDSRIGRIKVDRQLSPAAGKARVPSRPLQQVLVNLVLNALDAMDEVERPRLTLRTDYVEGWAICQVQDNGHGVRREHIDQLFEPFFTTKPVGKGTGLGLSVSYGLVRQMGGRIEVQSDWGQGATFTVRLPAGEAKSQ